MKISIHSKTLLLAGTILLGTAAIGQQIIQVQAGESIQAAINTAQVGDTIKVAEGAYDESLLIYKSVSIIGEDKWKTVITGGDNGTQAYNELRTMLIYADNLLISNLTITQQSTSVDAAHNTMGILLEAVDNVSIRNCRINNHITGIYISGSSNCNIRDNILEGCGNGVLFASAVFNTQNNDIRQNKIRDNGVANEQEDAGVRLISNYSGQGNTLIDNDIENNTFGINNETTNFIDATRNWWGSPTGPQNSSNPNGGGNGVSGFVIFQGWLDVATTNETLSANSPDALNHEPRLYPNPATDQFTIQFDGASNSEAMIHISDLQGKQVYSSSSVANVGENMETVDVRELKAGIYVVRLDHNGQTGFARLVVR